MSFAETIASGLARDRDRVVSATWGHLAPELGKTYRGSVVFAHSGYGGQTAILSIDFKLENGTSLLDNPWSFEDVTNYICDWLCDQSNGKRGGNPGCIDPEGKIFRFAGSYCRFKNNTCRIRGAFTELRLV